MTGLLYGEECGSLFYSKRSKNDKGEYIYFQCGCRQRKGPTACANKTTIREDLLVGGHPRAVCFGPG